MKADWWPKAFAHIDEEQPFATEDVIIAETGSYKNQAFRVLSTGLISEDQLKVIKAENINFDIHVNGTYPPDPLTKDSVFTPEFRIETFGEVEGFGVLEDLEPLIVSWTSRSNKTLIWPDQGFLMTYGLIPRIISEDEIHWDRLEDPPHHGAVKMTPVSIYDSIINCSRAYITVKRDFLKDYSTLRGKVIIQLYFETGEFEIDDEIADIIKERTLKTFPDRGFLFTKSRNGKYIGEVRGFRVLTGPGESPISSGRWDYGELTWPGIDKPITHDGRSWAKQEYYVYVHDTVLADYEGRQEYDIYPESGGVSYSKGQWTVTECDRIGRNIIRIKLRKMYEGAPPLVVKHWNKYAVDPPQEDIKTLPSQQNIAKRAKAIVFAYISFGEKLAGLISSITEKPVILKELIKFDRQTLEYNGWWKGPNIEPITRHIPLKMNKEEFLDRCESLYSLIGEGLSEKLIRGALTELKIDRRLIEIGREQIKGYRSIKLLDTLLELVNVSNETGLDLVNDSEAILAEWTPNEKQSKLSSLFSLNELRQLAVHGRDSGSDKKLKDNLCNFDITLNSTTHGYGEACDRVYDKLSETLSRLGGILSGSPE